MEDPDSIALPDTVRQIVDELSACRHVSAMALGGSKVGQLADEGSDHDVYVFTTGDIPLELRRDLAERFDPDPEIGNTWFGPGDEWTDHTTETAIDLMYWDRDWFEGQIRDVIERHRPSLGYSTAFWYTLRHSVPLFDHKGWLAILKALAESPYPEELRRAIIARNHPLLRTTQASYRHQIKLAIHRDDPVSVNHRVTALLASVFDVVFALNRALHPGEKRQLSHVAELKWTQSAEFDQRVRSVLRAAAAPVRRELLTAIDDLCDAVDASLRRAGLLELLAIS